MDQNPAKTDINILLHISKEGTTQKGKLANINQNNRKKLRVPCYNVASNKLGGDSCCGLRKHSIPKKHRQIINMAKIRHG